MTIAEVRHLFTYTEWANERVLSAAEKLPPEELLRDVRISYKSILGTLLHMAGAEWMWLERWNGNSPVGPDVWAGWTPGDARSLQQVREKWEPVVRRRNEYLDQISDADLARELGYRRFTGEPFSLPLVQQMQHVVNHATLHRGQVVGMIRQLDVVPPTTDLLFYLMESRQPSS
ncbi:MAG TPA: DinB family protein [Vicinamibacterales bacterium]|nr:DinB family protein [Vicinamibacterales bacterium]